MSTTFVPDCLKYVSIFSGKIFEAAEFWCDEVTLWAKLFVYKQQFVNFPPDCSIRTVKCTERMSLLKSCIPAHVPDLTLLDREEIICVGCDQCRCCGCNVFTSIINSGKTMETLSRVQWKLFW